MQAISCKCSLPVTDKKQTCSNCQPLLQTVTRSWQTVIEKNMSRIVVLGAGESGAGAAVLAKVKGFDTFVSDMSAIKDKYKALLNKYDIAGKRDNTQRN